MCGIAGCVSIDRAINKDSFERMVDIIEHRGPDDRGIYYESNLALGHRRLSIIDLSVNGHQPFEYMSKYVVVYNGEIYNYLELREELQKKGCVFQTKTDTEVVAAAYQHWGETCVDRFNGMWAFAIYDKERQMLFCSRDRFGVKPFYYTEQEGMFLFASEIKQFFEMLEAKPRANRERLLQYLVRGVVDGTKETMFQDVFQLLGGYNLIFYMKEKKFQIMQYYNLETINDSAMDFQQASELLRKEFENSVRMRLRADVPVGYCLSGGLDSSSIVCMASKILDTEMKEQHCISSCFEDKRYDEQEYIDEVIQHTGMLSHKIFPTEQELLEQMDKIIWHMDEPFASTSIYAQWHVFGEAKKLGLKVMLDGQGADEQLAGYTNFYSVRFFSLLRRKEFKQFWLEWKVYREKRAATEKYVSSVNILFSALKALMLPERIIKAMKYLRMTYPVNRTPFERKLLRHVIMEEYSYNVTDEKGFILDNMRRGMASLLHYEDRNSMACSIESRVPFLDFNLVEAIYSMPFEYKLREGITKYILRDGLKGILPEKIRCRYSKLGFVTPEDQWINQYRDEFQREIETAAGSLKPIINENRLKKWYDEKKGKFRRKDATVWRLICAAHWMQIFQVRL